jgi:hypothetical protein
MFVNNQIKKQLENLSNIEENKKCFDCQNEPARWTSLNNGIFLCNECSEEHKNFGLGTNIIKSVSLDQWNKSQLNIMKIGGNKRLKTFLEENDVPQSINKRKLYHSKLMVYYRKKLKAEAEGELLLDQIPPKEEFWESYEDDNNINIESNNGKSNIDINLNINKLNSNKANDNFNTNENENRNIVFYDNDNENQFVDGHILDYPKSSIIINEEHYAIAKENKIMTEKLENSVLKKGSLLEDYKDDPKFDSVSSDGNSELNSSFFQNSGYIGTIGNIIYSVWDATSTVKEKINEYPIGRSLLYIGGKVYDGVTYIGGALVHKAGEGLIYIAHKITGTSDNSTNENNNNHYIDIDDEIVKDNNKSKSYNSDIENNYGIMNDQKENLLV